MLVLKHVYPALASDGEHYEIHVYVDAPDDPRHGAPIEKIAKVCLADGRALKVVGKGRYKLEDGSMTLESHDPAAI